MGWSGARWLLTSSTIDRVMNNECTLIQLASSDNKIQVTKLMSMFVDDAAQLYNSFSPPQTSIMDQTTFNLQLHSDLVYTTGGKLAHDKCKFYYVQFYFDENGNAKMFDKKNALHHYLLSMLKRMKWCQLNTLTIMTHTKH